MRYITITDIKRQCVIDECFHEDDEYLVSLATVAEDMVEQEIDKPLEEVVNGNYGELPSVLKQACLLMVDYLYSTQRGSAGNGIEVPEVIYRFCRLYRQFN